MACIDAKCGQTVKDRKKDFKFKILE